MLGMASAMSSFSSLSTVHAPVHLEQLRLAVRVAVALQAGSPRTRSLLCDGVTDANVSVYDGIIPTSARIATSWAVVPRLEREREVLVLLHVGAPCGHA
jgi:hypothetical protein